MKKFLLTAALVATTTSGFAAPLPVNLLVCGHMTRSLTETTSCMVGLLRDSIPDLQPNDRIRAHELIAYIYFLGARVRDKSMTEGQAQEALNKLWVGAK